MTHWERTEAVRGVADMTPRKMATRFAKEGRRWKEFGSFTVACACGANGWNDDIMMPRARAALRHLVNDGLIVPIRHQRGWYRWKK